MNNLTSYLNQKFNSKTDLAVLLQKLQFFFNPWGKNLENYIFIDFYDRDFFLKLTNYIHNYKIVLTNDDYIKHIKFNNELFNKQSISFFNYKNFFYPKIKLCIISFENVKKYSYIKNHFYYDCENKNFFSNTIKNNTEFGQIFQEVKKILIKNNLTKLIIDKNFSEVINNLNKKNKQNNFMIFGKFNEKILNNINYLSKNFNQTQGKIAFCKKVFIYNNLVIQDNKIILNFLKFNDLASGFDNIKKNLFSANNKFFQILHFIKNNFFSNTIYFKSGVSGAPLAHWLIDTFIPFISLKMIYPKIKMIYDSKLTNYQKNYLRLFDIDLDDIVIIDKNKKYFFNHIVANIYEDNFFPEFCYNSLHSFIIENILIKSIDKIPDLIKFKKIYVSRRDALNARILINEEEIEKSLKQNGFQIVNSSYYSDMELLSIFKNAEIVIGPLGSGLLNLFFSKNLKLLISLSSEFYYEDYLKQILSFKSCKHLHIVGETIPAYDREEGGYRNSNFYINPRDLLDLLSTH